MSDWNQTSSRSSGPTKGRSAGCSRVRRCSSSTMSEHAPAPRRVTPLMYQTIPGGYAVFASKAGADSNPDWFYNVTANGDTTVEVGSSSLPVTVRVAQGDEHDDIWNRQKHEWPQFAEYERQTSRDVIPVIVLERQLGPRGDAPASPGTQPTPRRPVRGERAFVVGGGASAPLRELLRGTAHAARSRRIRQFEFESRSTLAGAGSADPLP